MDQNRIVSKKNNTILLIMLIIPCLSGFSDAESQRRVREEAPPLKERIFLGGSFGLQIGSVTDIEVSPIVGLWVLPRLAVASGPNYRFYKDPIYGKTSIYGGHLYTDFVIIKDLNSIIPLGLNFGLFFHLEDEYLSLESAFWKDPPYSSDRFGVNTILAGGGISQPLGMRGSMNFMILWAVNQPLFNLYDGPEVRVSFTF